ncbi:hypothetical protein CMUS01_15531 [Colletotrichum musicola]|uniref:Uncharacterized protein n=1 Tax=Colletotrichum musicola TaxID=2175873 RepID=A0A8H6IW00_9PEZI|nr:hypothetical protein CMUS01_15531 [Colletotrichum musicola]
MANTHTSCKCNSGDGGCTVTACTGYGNSQKFFNIPRNIDGTPGAQEQNGRCFAIYSDGKQIQTFEGLGGNEFKAECLKACNVGSSC